MKNIFAYFFLLCALSSAAQSLLPVKVNNKWGFINLQGKVVVSCDYDFVSSFGKDGLALASYHNVLTVIDTLGERKTPDHAEDIKLLGNKLFLIKINKRWGVSNFKKEFPVAPVYKSLLALSPNLLAAQDSNGLWGCITVRNITLLPFKFDRINYNGTGLIEARKGKDDFVYSDRGVFLYSSADKTSKLINGKYLLHQIGRYWGIKDTTGRVIITYDWDYAKVETSGLIRFSKNKKALLFSAFDGIVLADNLQRFEPVRENIFLFVNDSLRGLVDINGKIIVPAEFKKFNFNGNFICCTYHDDRWVLYTSKGMKLLPGTYDELNVVDDLSVVLVKRSSKWALWNVDGKELNGFNADTITIQDSIVKIFSGDVLRKLTLNTNGQILKEEKVKNVSRIKVRRALDFTYKADAAQAVVGTANFSKSSMLGIDDPNADTTYNGNWFYVKKRQQWGLLDNNGKVKISPVFTRVLINDSMKYTVVYSAYWFPNNFNVDKASYNPEVTLGIYDHIHYKYLLEPQYTSLRYKDFNEGEFARCLPNFAGDEIAMVNLKGEVERKNFKYIGAFNEGLARCLVGGSLTVSKEQDRSTFISVLDFFTDLDGTSRPAKASGFLKNNGGQWGYINRSAAFQIAPQYSTAEDFVNKVAVVSMNYRYGLINSDGATIIPMRYDGIERMKNANDSLFLVSLISEKWGILNENGRVETSALYDDIQSIDNGKYFIYKRGKYDGILSANFVVLFEDTCKSIVHIDSSFFLLHYDSAYYHLDASTALSNRIDGERVEVKNNMLVLSKAKKYFIYTAAGKEIGVSRFPVKAIYNEGFVYFSSDKSNKELYGVQVFKSAGRQKPIFDELGKFTNGKSYFKSKQLYGIVEISGKVLVKAKFEAIGDASQGYRVFRSLASYGVMKEDGKVILQPNYSSVLITADNNFIVSKNDRFNLVNLKGDTLFKTWYAELNHFHNGLAIAKSAAEYFLVNELGVVQSRAYSNLEYLGDNLYKCSAGNGSVIMNEAGDTLSYLSDIYSFQLNRSAAIGELEGKKGLFNVYGAKIVAPKYNDLHYLGAGKYKYKLREFYQVYDVLGKEVVPIPAEAIGLINPDLFMVDAANKIGYLKRNGEWLWPLTF
ncbi:MAG: WG repeat-containing protein [Bacteroidetes bacterium]|nr:WG repeat-containing protein [Bacteroidota bacterium]